VNDNKQRITAQEAGYLELPGAVKDSDCSVVEVDGGVSSEKGCCNSFGIKPETDSFRCGECKYLAGQEERDGEEKPLGRREARTMSDKELLDSNRPVQISSVKGER
jgi:hypothetical protein